MERCKPYFTAEQVNEIINVFRKEVEASQKEFSQRLENSIREYVQGSKSEYENNILRDVLAGEYLCTIINEDDVAYKPAQPIEKDVNDIIEMATQMANGDISRVPSKAQVEHTILVKRAEKLSRALNMSTLKGKPQKLKF